MLDIDRDSLEAIQKTGYKIFTGLSQGTVKVLKDPEVQKEGKAPDSASSSKLGSEEEGDETPAPSNDRKGAGQGRRLLLTPYPPCQTRGPSQKIPRQGKSRGEGEEDRPSPSSN
jgi:hypothetical protein